MKITSLFSRVPHRSCESIAGNDEDNHSPKPKPFSDSVSSPDIIPPSPVLEKKKPVKAKRSLNPALVDDGSNEPEKLIISQTNDVQVLPKKTLDFIVQSPDKSNEYDHNVGSQSCTGTESMASTICDETDFCSDLTFDDWIDCSPTILKYLNSTFNSTYSICVIF